MIEVAKTGTPQEIAEALRHAASLIEIIPNSATLRVHISTEVIASEVIEIRGTDLLRLLTWSQE